MRRGKNTVIVIFLLAVVACLYFVIPYIVNMKTPDLIAVSSDDPIPLSKDESIHFFKEGLIILNSPSRFYDWSGAEILPPFKQDDLVAEGGNIDITHHTSNHISTSSGRIYNTSTVPFTLVYENKDINIWDMKEYADFLVLLVKNDELIIEPLILVQNSNFLISLDGMGNTRYISVANDRGTKDISLLTISIDSPVPVSRVFHYTNRNELYGVLTLENQLIHNIYRLKSNIVLIGINDILCYNKDGEQKWTIDNAANSSYDALQVDNGLLLYFPEMIQFGEIEGNTILVNNKGDYIIKAFPKYLTNLQVYNKGFVGLEYKNTLVFMNKQGNVTKKQRLPDQANSLVTTPYQPDNFYINTGDNTLQLYTTIREDDQE